MRGFDQRHDGLFSYVRPASRIPKTHPPRVIRMLADQAPTSLDDRFAALYSENGRPSIPPGQLLRALAAASLLHGSLRAAVDGATELQPAVPLVRRAFGHHENA